MLGNDATYFKAQRKDRRPIYKQLKLEETILYTLAGIFMILDFRKWVFCAFVPHLYAKFCIISLNLLQHDGCDEDSEYNHSRNFTGKMLNYFCYNNGYHSIHHKYPGLHWSETKKKHDEIFAKNIHPNLLQSSIMVYIFKTFIYPGVRVDYLGNKIEYTTPAEEDLPWFYHSAETYSSSGENFQ